MSNETGSPYPTVAYATPAPLGYAVPGVRALLPVLGRARAIIIAFWILAAAYVLGAVAVVGVFIAMPAIDAAVESGPASVLLAIAVAAMGVGLLFFAGFVVVVVLFCMWQHRVHNNAHVLATRPMAFTPGWGVGYWFFPILNLIRPYQVMREIDAATPPGERPIGTLIGWWWALFILSIATSLASNVAEGPDDAMNGLSLTFDLVTTGVDLAGIVLIVRIIRSITDRQAAIVGA